MEIWKKIEGIDDIYEVSNTGKVRTIDANLKGKDGITSLNFRGYVQIL